LYKIVEFFKDHEICTTPLIPGSQEKLTQILIEGFGVKLTDSEIKLEEFKNFRRGNIDLAILDLKGVKIEEVN
jgi:hypothetical protein